MEPVLLPSSAPPSGRSQGQPERSYTEGTRTDADISRNEGHLQQPAAAKTRTDTCGNPVLKQVCVLLGEAALSIYDTNPEFQVKIKCVHGDPDVRPRLHAHLGRYWPLSAKVLGTQLSHPHSTGLAPAGWARGVC